MMNENSLRPLLYTPLLGKHLGSIGTLREKLYYEMEV